MKLSIYILGIIGLVAFTFIPDEEDFITKLKSNVESYNQKYQPVVLQLNLSQPYYAVGDTISFNAFYLNVATRTLINAKQIANLELYDEQGAKVADEKFVLKQGVAGVQVPVSATLKPGLYTMVAYTDWMKNFQKENYPTKTVKIVGQNQVTLQNIPAEFYPSGGHFIAGIENDVDIRIPDVASEVSASIKAGNDVVSQLTFKNGWARSTFVPSAGVGYVLEINGDATRATAFPAVETTGISIRLANDGDKSIAKLFFTSDVATLTKNFYLAVINTSTIAYSTRLDPAKISQEIVLGPRQITGPSMITVLSDDGKLWAMLYASPAEKSTHAEIQIDRPEVSVRDSVEVNISLADDLGPVNGTFGVSVFNAGLFSQMQSSPRLTFAPNFNWLNWDMILSGNIKEPAYKTLQYLTIEGEASFADSNKPVADSTLLMFYFEKQIIGYEVYTSNGKFKVPVFFDFTEPDMVYYAASRRGRDLKGVTLKFKAQEASMYNVNRTSSLNTPVTDEYGTFRAKTRLIQSSFQYFTNKKASENPDPNFAVEDELGGADLVVNLKDYLVFPTMAEVVKEVLPSVEHRRIGGQDMMKIYTSHKRPVNNAEPVYVIDGVITKSTEAFLSLNPADVVTLKVIKNGSKLIRLGKLFDNGVILARTTSGAGLKMNRETVFPIRGLLPPTTAKRAAAKSKNIPDFRATLLWIPLAKSEGSGATIKIPTSDDIGDFTIQVDGLTADGRSVSTAKTFKVSLPKQ